MNISVFGLGYVGAVSAACLAKSRHNVIGVDTDQDKVDMINHGKTPVIEKDLEGLISFNVKSQRLTATSDAVAAIKNSDLSLICVGTPSMNNGNIDLNFVKRVCCEIGSALADKADYHIVIMRSTVLPGTIEEMVIPTLEKCSGKKAGRDFGVANNPEFLREATAVYDFYHPPKIVIGSENIEDGRRVERLYRGIEAPVLHTTLRIAEIVKYADNTFHALKITFANEIGLLCKSLGIDSHEVMNIFCQDTKLNLSSAYLKPGFAFGGSCLPKDLRAITYLARHKDLELPVLTSILPSNNAMVEHALQLIKSREGRKIGILGFAFKAGTDDLRESPVVTLIERLLGQGYAIKIFDKNVSLAVLRGANRRYIQERIPHIAALMCNTIEDVVGFADILVIGNKDEEFVNIFDHSRSGQIVLDLVRISEEIDSHQGYEGVSW